MVSGRHWALSQQLFAQLSVKRTLEHNSGADRESIRFYWQKTELVLNFDYYSQSCWFEGQANKILSTSPIYKFNFNPLAVNNRVTTMEKVLVSACLLGLAVRYDGASKGLVEQTLRSWQQQGRVIGVCPEVTGGLSIPRAAAEIQPLKGTNDGKRKITTALGNDVSTEFYRGAQHALYLCQRHKSVMLCSKNQALLVAVTIFTMGLLTVAKSLAKALPVNCCASTVSTFIQSLI